MKKISISLISFSLIAWFFTTCVQAQNPFITDQFTADPSARVFNGKVYVYPSHDILANEERGRVGWFCMADYHVFSSSDLVNWTDHGVIVTQEKVDWVDPESYSMWAPDCIERDGKYYFYFPSRPKGEGMRRGFAIGVAVANHPEGPFVPESEPIKGVIGIDPNPYIDNDGQAYLYWSMGKIFVAKLKDNMLELDGEPQEVTEMPTEGLKEGPYLFERNGIYYMTYPHVENNIERIEYAISDNPMGPFTFAGVIMDESPIGCWTNHQSIIEYNDQWYIFYHQNDLSPKFDKSRSIRVDSLFFNEDGTIQKVEFTQRGVGISDATEKIEIDRYSDKSDAGVSVAFIDTLNTFDGWKTVFDSVNSWIRYNAVDVGTEKLKKVQLMAKAPGGGAVQIRSGSADGPLLSKVKLPAGSDWHIVEAKVSKLQPGIHDLVIMQDSDKPLEIDWIRFIK
ncbi:family 43 glycosylhydrolase [Bacteroidota bacterium]